MALSGQALHQEHGEIPSIACDLLKDWASKPEEYYFMSNAVTGEEQGLRDPGGEALAWVSKPKPNEGARGVGKSAGISSRKNGRWEVPNQSSGGCCVRK